MSRGNEIPSEAELRAWYNQTDKCISFEKYERRTIAMRRRVSKAKREPSHGSYVEGGRYYTTYDDPILPSQAFVWEWLQFLVEERTPEICTGKWMLFHSMEETDRLWPLLKDALQQRLLGESMKAGTNKLSKRVLTCIYTKDWQDVDDVRRVLVALRKIISDTERIYYKSDEQTLTGLSGSIYCSPNGENIELTPKGREWYAQSNVIPPTL
jgi:hypothetical protein